MKHEGIVQRASTAGTEYGGAIQPVPDEAGIFDSIEQETHMCRDTENNVVATVIEKKHLPRGILVKLENGDIGLVHVSQLRGNTRSLRDKRLGSIQVGDEVYVEIQNDGRKNAFRRLTLSERSPQEKMILERMPTCEFITGYVYAKTNYGAFVYLHKWHVSGLLHISNMEGMERDEQTCYHRNLRVGDVIVVMVTEILQQPDCLQFQLSQMAQD